MNKEVDTVKLEVNNILCNFNGRTLDKETIDEIVSKVGYVFEHKDDYILEKKYKDFYDNIHHYLDDKSIEWGHTHSTILLCEEVYRIHPEEIIELLFSEFLQADEEYNNLIRENVVTCIWWIGSWADFSEKELQWIYSMLRMSFESDDHDLKSYAISLIEQIRNKICLNILLDYNSKDYMFPWLIKYANKIIEELEEELSVADE